MSDPAPILSFEEFAEIRAARDLGRIVCTSGGFDPMHPGHASCIVDSAKHGDTLVVLVNGDAFLRNKKGRAFMDLMTRCRIVSCVRNVDYVIPFEIEDDQTVTVALRKLRPDAFTKGGDRTDYTNIPEWPVLQELGIELIPQVGLRKDWSSSNLLDDWVQWAANRSDG